MGKTIDRSILEGECIVLFRAAIKSPHTLDPYERRLVNFLNWYGKKCDDFVADAKANGSAMELKIIAFIESVKQRIRKGEISGGVITNHLKAVRLLLDMNDVALNWKKIRRTVPRVRRYALDRIPTMEELRLIISNADLRGRALTLTFLSSGIREGAIEYLKIADCTPVMIDDEIVAGRLFVYAGEEEQYVAYISKEAYLTIQKYLQFREKHGETLHKMSPLFRDKFDPIYKLHHGHFNGVHVEKPEFMTGPAIRKYYNYLFHELGLREGAKRRHEFSVHGFRKWFKTTAERAGMRPIDVETLMGHSTGISDSYYRPTEKDLLDSYLAISHHLTLSEVEQVKRELKKKESDWNQKFDRLEDLVSNLASRVQNATSESAQGLSAIRDAKLRIGAQADPSQAGNGDMSSTQ